MIIGVGTDLVETKRLESLWVRWGERIARRLLGPEEQKVFFQRLGQGAQAQSVAINYLAKRFAAKEAVGKALGCGLSNPMGLQNLEVLNDEKGAPQAVARGPLAELLHANGWVIHISLSDERSHAQAFALVEAR
jgi:holo-[acyl-carrier protein] synthase